MTFAAISLFALTEFVLSLSPGPAVFLIVSQSMRAGLKSSVRGTFGVMTAELIFFTLSALGLSAVLVASQVFFILVKWLGAVYLIYLGFKLLSSFRKSGTSVKPLNESKHYRQGLFMQLANPKAILFFTALLPQFIDPSLPAAQQFVVLGLVSMAVQGSTLVAYGWLAAKGGRLLKDSYFSRWLDRAAGLCLIIAGVKLALARR